MKNRITIEVGDSVPLLDEETFVRLEKLSRRAANDSLRAHPGAHLAEDQFDSLAVHLLGIGIRAFERYDPVLAGGMARETHVFRAMRGYRQGRFTEGPYVDWLRTHVRDARFEPNVLTAVTESGDLPERSLDLPPDIEDVVEHYAGGLPEREAWTLRHVAAAIASGNTLGEVCTRLLADLADALEPQMPGAPHSGLPPEFFRSWIEEAA